MAHCRTSMAPVDNVYWQLKGKTLAEEASYQASQYLHLIGPEAVKGVVLQLLKLLLRPYVLCSQRLLQSRHFVRDDSQ